MERSSLSTLELIDPEGLDENKATMRLREHRNHVVLRTASRRHGPEHPGRLLGADVVAPIPTRHEWPPGPAQQPVRGALFRRPLQVDRPRNPAAAGMADRHRTPR